MKIFGINFTRAKEEEELRLPTPVPPDNDDGAFISAPGGAYGTSADIYGSIRTESDLVMRYRNMAIQPEVDSAIDEIVNEMISLESADGPPIRINLDAVPFSDKVKDAIEREFNNILDLLKFSRDGYNIIRRWYIDGKIRYFVMVDPNNLQDGIKELRYLDARKIKKVRIIQDINKDGSPSSVAKVGPIKYKEYYAYTPTVPGGPSITTQAAATQAIPIAKDSIIESTSGLTDANGTMLLSHLHMALRVASQLRMLEDATIIYRIVRAPERRVWFIDVGNLPRMKADQYVRDIMVKHKNMLSYDPSTGQVKDQRKFMNMLEDYWLPRREGGKGTEVSNLPPGQASGALEEITQFQQLLYASLHVPLNRLSKDDIFGLGKPSEISRDEIKFAKFIARLRVRFSELFFSALEKQLVLKNIVSVDDWDSIKYKLRFEFSKDNHFAELKDQEVLASRLDIVDRLVPYVGRYVSNQWILKNIFQQTDHEMGVMRQQIEQEQLDPIFAVPMPGTEPTIVPEEEPEEEDKGEPGKGPNNDKSWLIDAQTTYDLLKKKTNRTPDEQSQFRSAAQILGHADYAKKPRKSAKVTNKSNK